MATDWYYSKNGSKHGPVASAELKALARAGKLLPTDLIWKEGMSSWKPATKVKGLFAAAPMAITLVPLGRQTQRTVPVGVAPTSPEVTPATRPAFTAKKIGIVTGCVAVFGLLLVLVWSGAVPLGSARSGRQAAASMTVDEFRKAADLPDADHWSPKQKFYDKFGKPQSVMTVGDDTYLHYKCKDGIARVRCLKLAFEYDNRITILGINQSS
jgi:hypothetical protein